MWSVINELSKAVIIGGSLGEIPLAAVAAPASRLSPAYSSRCVALHGNASGFKNRHQLNLSRSEAAYLNLLSPCLFLKPYIKAGRAFGLGPLNV